MENKIYTYNQGRIALGVVHYERRLVGGIMSRILLVEFEGSYHTGS